MIMISTAPSVLYAIELPFHRPRILQGWHMHAGYGVGTRATSHSPGVRRPGGLINPPKVRQESCSTWELGLNGEPPPTLNGRESPKTRPWETLHYPPGFLLPMVGSMSVSCILCPSLPLHLGSNQRQCCTCPGQQPSIPSYTPNPVE